MKMLFKYLIKNIYTNIKLLDINDKYVICHNIHDNAWDIFLFYDIKKMKLHIIDFDKQDKRCHYFEYYFGKNKLEWESVDKPNVKSIEYEKLKSFIY
jgi:hypothetical protein